MHGQKNEHKNVDEVGDGGEGARGGRPHSLKRWAAGPATSSNQ